MGILLHPQEMGSCRCSRNKAWDADGAGDGMRLGMKMWMSLKQAGLVTELFGGKVWTAVVLDTICKGSSLMQTQDWR